jgi:hypothetical protein
MSPDAGDGSERQTLPLRPVSPHEAATLPPHPDERGREADAPEPARALSFGDYEILSELGRGGMGVVYKAWQKSLKRTVALKMIRGGAHAGREDLGRFKTEAESVARLRHPNIVQIHEVGEQDGLPYFSLEFVEGGTLADRVAGTPLDGTAAARLVQTLAEAVHHAHVNGVVHRDLKPGNVLLTADGTPKVTDFGLAKRLDEAGQTQSNSILGTPSYMAPEQAAGKNKEVGAPADVYALGAVLYELLTGRPPFRAATPLDTVLQVVSAEPAAPRLLNPKIRRDLETICLKCLQKEPHKRYASAAALADDLRRFLAGEPIEARPVSAAERLWRWGRRHPARAALLVVSLLLLLVVLGGGFWFTRRLQAELGRTEAAQRELQQALTLQVAERLDADLRQLAAVPAMMAVTLELHPEGKEERLAAWLREILRTNKHVFGTCVAFEPGRFEPARKDFALYAHRTAGGLDAKQLPASYRYRTWPWYTRPLKEGRAVWSEPFLDEGGGNIPMVTRSVPLRRGKDLVGVVTIDLSMDYFKDLGTWLNGLKLGEGGYGFVVSREGTFISYPDGAYRMPRKITEVNEFQADDALRAFTGRLLREERGAATAVDPRTGRPASFLFARVPSTGWAFVAVLGE